MVRNLDNNSVLGLDWKIEGGRILTTVRGLIILLRREYLVYIYTE